jgi:hypothetical protein
MSLQLSPAMHARPGEHVGATPPASVDGPVPPPSGASAQAPQRYVPFPHLQTAAQVPSGVMALHMSAPEQV